MQTSSGVGKKGDMGVRFLWATWHQGTASPPTAWGSAWVHPAQHESRLRGPREAVAGCDLSLPLCCIQAAIT